MDQEYLSTIENLLDRQNVMENTDLQPFEPVVYLLFAFLGDFSNRRWIFSLQQSSDSELFFVWFFRSLGFWISITVLFFRIR